MDQVQRMSVRATMNFPEQYEYQNGSVEVEVEANEEETR